MVQPQLVADRACGSCTVCCVALKIDEPALQKLPGYRCHNLRPDGGCGIYEARPQTCRVFFCGWRQLKWVRPSLRPDRSGVLLRLIEVRPEGQEAPKAGLVVMLLTEAALAADGLAEAVAAAVQADIATFLNIPGPPGHTSSMGRINEAVSLAVRQRDKAAILATLRQLRLDAVAAEHRPVALTKHASLEQSPADGAGM